MEDFNRQQEKRKFFEFVEVIEQRVNDIGAQKGSTARSGDAVIERLYKSSGGKADKVTEEDIASAFDDVDKRD
jgi:hypothetical protein